MNIELKDKHCNGWVLVYPRRLVAENAKNIHIVEVRIDAQGKIVYWSDSTCCAEDLTATKRHIKGCIFPDTPEGRSALRRKVADLQNNCHEVCGSCAGHLYADCIA